MEHYVLDTNLFFNMEAGLDLGSTTEAVVGAITKAAKNCKKNQEAIFYTPPRIVEEFLSFFEKKDQQFIRDFLASITVQSPQIHRDQIPASVFYTLIDDIRTRSYRGLSVGEENIKQAGKLLNTNPQTDKKGFELTIGPVVKNFRERYRQATRYGFLDSVADLDLIMLARELDAHVVTADEGVLRWGRLMGMKEISLPVFGDLIKKAM